jgi:rubrerythrin
MKKPTDIGRNRTGIATSPVDAARLAEGADLLKIVPIVSGRRLGQERMAFARSAPPVGTMSPPASLSGAARALAGALQGEKLTVLLDQVGERLAFERTGYRLYEGLIAKLAGADPHPGGPTEEELRFIRDQELEHFHLLCRAAERLGGDPTVMTPSADVVGVASQGLLAVVADSHTTFNQALKAILVAELTDVDSWELLASLADALDQEEMAAEFEQAAEHEEQHLVLVRSWLQRSIAGEAGVESEMAEEAPAPPGV